MLPLKPITILLIEDSPSDTALIQEALAQEKHTRFTLRLADRLSMGLQQLDAGGVDLVLLDLLLPDSDGLETLLAVRNRAPRVPIVVLTASDDDTLALRTLQRGAQDYLVKGYVQVYRNLLGRSIRYAIERRRAEEEVRNAQAHTETLLASVPSILIGVNAKGVVTHWNAVAEATFGIPAMNVLNRPLAGCGIRWETERILACIAECRRTSRPASVDDVPFQRADRQEGFVGITVVLVRRPEASDSDVLVFGADVTGRKQGETERSRLQEQLIQSQKMETVGRFAGGIAHDFNNFLQIILGFTGLISVRYRDDPALLGDLQEIIHAAESASGMVQQLLAFSRRQPLQLKTLEINQTIQHMTRLLTQLVGEQIEVVVQLDSAPLVVKWDPTWVEQILMNLCANARDSMPQGGTLTIRTTRVMADETFIATRPWWTKHGPYIQLSIQDTGKGMEPGVAAHIFEPFFTTKQLGKGTGLGLAVVYGLVKQHGGFIDVETAPGRGTTFHLYFPAQELPQEEQLVMPQPSLAASDETSAQVQATGGDGRPATSRAPKKKRVLVVDDNVPILLLCSRILRSSYEVTTVSSARAALDALRREPYDLLLTDLRMPNMDGTTLLTEAAKLKPAPRILAMTGSFPDEMEEAWFSGTLSDRVIRKPFTASELLEIVTHCLS